MTRFLLTSSDVKQVDVAAVNAGIPLEVLMEAAGRAVADAIRGEHPISCGVLVVCGKGNNGGDGFVVARWLLVWGYTVQVWALPGAGSAGAAQTMRQALLVWMNEQPILELTADHLETLALELDQKINVLVDGIFGSSFRMPLPIFESELISRLNTLRNARGWKVWAIDLASGLLADSGEAPGLTMQVDFTVALSGFKPAHVFAPASSVSGKLELAEIGIPPWIVREHASAELADPRTVFLPSRTQDAHKGSAGRVIVAGGLPRYPGAPALAAHGAFRAGAGLVKVITPAGSGLQAPVEATRHEIETWTRGDLEFLKQERCDALVAGMGMGPVKTDLLELLITLEAPIVLDADALQPELEFLLTSRWDRHDKTIPDAILTPHPGEAARLLGVSTQSITFDPLAAARTLAQRFNAVVVLKGGPTVIAHPQRSDQARVHLWVNTSGNPGMASAGMGDVLGGVIAGLLAQGVDAVQAARTGVYLHGRAGDLAALEYGFGLSASDVADVVPKAWLECLSRSI
jgi:ADP-dependent NAD(P)H-hydrate dehydratase / NAD(P)H-hydrate epimerase